MIQHYELVYLLRTSTSEPDARALTEDITKRISAQGTIEKSGEIGKRKLAYQIKHEEYAIYWLYEFNAETSAIKELHHMLSLDERILRFLIVSTKPKTTEDTEREERMKESLERARLKDQQVERDKDRKVLEKEKTKTEEKTKHVEKEKISLEELDKKLDELLEDDSLTT